MEICSHFLSGMDRDCNNPNNLWCSTLICWKIKHFFSQIELFLFSCCSTNKSLKIRIYLNSTRMYCLRWTMRSLQYLPFNQWIIRHTEPITEPQNTVIGDIKFKSTTTTQFSMVFNKWESPIIFYQLDMDEHSNLPSKIGSLQSLSLLQVSQDQQWYASK